MSVLAAVREFDSGTAIVGSTFDIDFGFTPILLIFAGANVAAADVLPISKLGNGKQSFGFGADDLSVGVLAGAVQNAVGTTATQRHLSNIACFMAHAHGSGTILGSLDINSILATGVRMEVVVQFVADVKGIVLALGDDGVPATILADAEVINDAIAVADPTDLTGFTFDPEHVMTLSRAGTAALPESGGTLANCIGSAKSATEQAYISNFDVDGAGTSSANSSSRDGDQAHVRASGGINQRLNFNSLIVGGIRYNQDEAVLADQIMLAGWDIGGFSTVASSLTETDLITLFAFTTGFRAAAGIFFSPHFAEDALDATSIHDRWMIGFFARQPNGTIEEMCVGLFSESGLGTSRVKIAQRDASMYVGLAAGAPAGPESHASIDNVQATKIECIMTLADPAQRFVWGVFFGPGNFPAPTLDSVLVIDPTQIDLSWTNNEAQSVDPDFWAIERESPSGGGFSEIATVIGSVTTFSDVTVVPSTQNCYRIVGRVTGEGDSLPSNEICTSTGSGSISRVTRATPDLTSAVG